MIFLSDPEKAAPVECPYLPGRLFVQDYFFATDVDEFELGMLLDSGWRHFGSFFFRPSCPGCRLCVPIRIDARRISPSSSQKRIRARGKSIQMEAVSPRPSDEAWSVYEAHSKGQFNKEVNRASFERSFYEKAVPALQTEYRIDGTLIALGFLDCASEGMSSVYFSFDPEWARYSPGVLSVFRESELVRNTGKSWYYLGYWISGCPAMEYKARYGPHQLFDWERSQWYEPPSALSDQGMSPADTGRIDKQQPGTPPPSESTVPVHNDSGTTGG